MWQNEDFVTPSLFGCLNGQKNSDNRNESDVPKDVKSESSKSNDNPCVTKYFTPFISNRVSPKYNQVKRVLDRDKKLSFLIGDKGCVASVSGHILIRYAQRIYSGGRYPLKFVLPKEYVAKEYPCDNADEIGNE